MEPAANARPETMTAVEIINPGPDGILKPTIRPVPEPGPGEVLIRVAAAGLNRPDIIQRQGRYDPPPGVSDLPGLEVAGTVAGGDGEAGTRICALVAGGGYAEYCVAPKEQCLPIPNGLSFIDAAGIPETFFTVWRNLIDLANFREGETVLIHGGASGIGTTAIQLVKAFGGRVFVTAGTEEKCKACENLGADLAINYKTQDFSKEILNATGSKGVDIIIDMIGGDYVPRNQACLGENGRHISIAIQHGKEAEIDLFQIMRKRQVFTGSVLRPRPVAEKAKIAESLKTHVWPLLERGDIKPVIFKTFPLEDAAAAHALMESGDHIGKVILVADTSQISDTR